MKPISIIRSPTSPGPGYTQVSEEFVEWAAESYKVSEMINGPFFKGLIVEMEREIASKRNNYAKSKLG